jgi:hypothetical protein
MFPDFEELRPLFAYMFNHGPVRAHLTNLSINAECLIPSLPRLQCDAASIRLDSMEVLEECYSLVADGDAKIKNVTLKTPYCTFHIDYNRKRATLKTQTVSLVTVYRTLVGQVPGLTLQVLIPAQN